MRNLLPVILLFLTSSWAGAAMNDMEQASAPSEVVDVAYVVLFVILFFGMIAWFFIHMWRNERNKKRDE